MRCLDVRSGFFKNNDHLAIIGLFCYTFDHVSKYVCLLNRLAAMKLSRSARSIRQRSKKGSPYSITERRVPELIPVLCSQPTGGVSHKPGGRLPLLSARPAVTLATLKRAATSFAAW